MKHLLMLIFMLTAACAQLDSGEVPKGSESKLLTINTKPTEAAIYKDGHYIGHSPLRVWLWHGAPSNSQIIALPLYQHQFIQVKSLRIPTIPTQLTFYMTEPSEHQYDFLNNPTQSQQEQQPSQHLKRLQLFFEFDQAQLTIAEIARLTHWLGQLNTAPYRIELHAYADETGSQEYNKALSYRRALAIKQYLQDLAIKPEELLVIHHGERVSLNRELRLSKQGDRMVELLVFYLDHDTKDSPVNNTEANTSDNKKAPGL